jgi:hypothetical protein
LCLRRRSSPKLASVITPLTPGSGTNAVLIEFTLAAFPSRLRPYMSSIVASRL